jgi:hypothetical protein
MARPLFALGLQLGLTVARTPVVDPNYRKLPRFSYLSIVADLPNKLSSSCSISTLIPDSKILLPF